ncbi:hypothetical protein CcI49_28380 [Frankia sp. CcI49]|uniref:hypothetical protein n=1 Tax=Frankia sp. CcI49 TaxID=1745382 RepID=UPI000975A765|nr:hypothetical protein [Frankia sp. CcI49]ONH55444.1 hypothetical protein CcI49_28380 [Frankia sp. CcI49]
MSTPVTLPDLPGFGDEPELTAVARFHNLIGDLADHRRMAGGAAASPFGRAHAAGWVAGTEATLGAASAAISAHRSMRAPSGQRHTALRGRLVAATRLSRQPGDVLRRVSEAGFLAGACATYRALMALADARIGEAAEQAVIPR